MAETAAIVDIVASDNATLMDAFQFGTLGDTSWSFTNQSFKMEIKASADDVAPLITITSALGAIVVDDAITRVLHLFVDMATLNAALPVGEYVYDFIMFDNSVPAIRVLLMQGAFSLRHGVTED